MKTNKKHKDQKRQKQSASHLARTKTKNLAETLPDEQLRALVEGARFAHAQEKTKFQREFAEEVDRRLRARLDREEPGWEKAELDAALEGQETVSKIIPPKTGNGDGEFPGK